MNLKCWRPLIIATVAGSLLATPALRAQQAAALPAVNLGDTSFLDGIAFPGWVFELIGQGVHDNKTADNSGAATTPTDVNSGAALVHVAWLSSRAKVAGAWVGGEVVLSDVYVDTDGHGIGHGFGDVTVGPVFQWPEKRVLGMPFYQRFVLDIDVPLGQYSSAHAVNVGSNAVDVHPYYAFTAMPLKHLEVTARSSYLWDGTNSSPSPSLAKHNTQAGQAIHFNATTSYEVLKGLYLGANAYYLKQITDARADGVAVASSKEQIAGIGPGGVYHRNQWFYYVNGYHELGARNMAQGNKLVLHVERVF